MRRVAAFVAFATLAACGGARMPEPTLFLDVPDAMARVATVETERTPDVLRVRATADDVSLLIVVPAPELTGLVPTAVLSRGGEIHTCAIGTSENVEGEGWLSFAGSCAAGRVKL